MMNELILFRHAQAGSMMESGRDFDRPLTEQGRSDALRQSDWLREYHLIPDTVLASPAVRTLQTAEIACEHLGFDPRRILRIDAIYEATTGDLIRVLEEYPGERVMLVGHNPGLSDLGSFLSGGYVGLRPGSAARITFDPAVDGTAQPGSGHLVGQHDV